MKKRTKNKLLAFGIIMCMLFAVAVVPVSAAIVGSGTCGENLTWTLDDEGTLTISGTGDIPSFAFSDEVFLYYENIKTVVIQNGVMSIGDGAFSLCFNLTDVTIPDSVTSIGCCAFEACHSLTSITIPDSVTSIGNMAFGACGLTSITIPDSVTYIDDIVFWGCENLESITISGSVTYIGEHVFIECSSLTSIDVNQNNEYYSSLNGVLFNKDKTTLIACPGGKTGSYTIPDSVTSIGDDAFNNCSSLTSVTIPDSVTSIGDGAFLRCSSLESITIPDSVTSIENSAFSGCTGLTSITLPDGVTSIESDTFSSCAGLTSITLPDGVTSIESYTFYGCSSLTDVYYGGKAADWSRISVGNNNSYLTGANIHFDCIFANKLKNRIDYSGETVSLPGGAVLDTGEALNFRNGYVNTGESGYVKAGDKKITGSNIYFTGSGKIRLEAGCAAKIERDNGDGTTDQGFLAGVYNPTGIIKMTLSVSGTVNDKDYTGRTISKDFDFTASEISGLANFGFEVKRVPKPLELSVKSIE